LATFGLPSSALFQQAPSEEHPTAVAFFQLSEIYNESNDLSKIWRSFAPASAALFEVIFAQAA